MSDPTPVEAHQPAGKEACSDLTIFPQHEAAFEEVLRDLEERCPAEFVLLAHVNGQLISVRGGRNRPELVALASLVAGDFAASQEIGRLTGTRQPFQLMLREGQESNTFISDAGRFVVLFAQVRKDVPLGWARLIIQGASRQLSLILDTPAEKVASLEIGLSDERLNGLLADAIDACWKE